MAPKTKTAHALITPWPISKGLMAWCGQSDKEVGEDLIAVSPESVTCQRCRDSMRTAYHNLAGWIDRLPP